MNSLQIALLGKPEFRLNGRIITNDLARKAQALIAYLTVTRQGHSREALAGLFWGEMNEESARRNLRVTLTKLRPYFDDHLVIQRRTLAFNLESDYLLDVDVFEAALHGPEQSLADLNTAVDLYRGPFLDDLPLSAAPGFDEWLRPYQERLRQMAMDALYRLAVHYTQERRFAVGIDYLGRLLVLEPWMEEAHRQLMLLLTLNGQRSAALAQYELCCDMLIEELGVEPAQPTIDLYEQILAGEIEEVQVEPLILQTAEPSFKWSPPFQSPALPRHFVGRDAFCRTIIDELTVAQPPIQAIVGMGGMGKTAAAVQIAHAVQERFEDGVLWANAATSDPRAILESWARLYGYEFEEVHDLPALASAFRGVLAGKRVLIVLDDVTSMTRIRPLLPGSDTVAVLLTTRDHDLAHALNARIWPLDPLSLSNGRLLLTQILGQERVEAEVQAADQICALLQNLPLAVEIVGQRLKSRPRRRLTDAAARLGDETRRLSELKISDREVRASFALSYDSLDAGLRHTFALMGLFAGRSFPVAALTAVADQDRYEVEDRIFTLIALSLAQEEEESRYSQHALLADFAREKLGDALEENGRLVRYYLDFVRQNQNDYHMLHPEWDNMMAALQTAHDRQMWSITIQLALALYNNWQTRGYFSQARRGLKLAYEAAVELNDMTSCAVILHYRGEAALEQHDHTSAQTHLTQSCRLYAELDDWRGQSSCLCLLAHLAVEESQYERAAVLLSESRALRQAHGDEIGVAETDYVEARLQYFQGDYKTAESLGKTALDVQDKYDASAALIDTLSLLASTAIHNDLLDQAEVYARRALTLCEQINDLSEKSIILDVLADIYRRRRQFETAETYARDSLQLLQRIGDVGSQAQLLYQLSRIYKDQADYRAALEPGQQCLTLCEDLRYTILEAFALINLAEIEQHLQAYEIAVARLEKAHMIGQQLNHPFLINRSRERLAQLTA